ncbi:MAG: CopG family transcriptional regulator [Gemmatimonadaceae bacterium]|nr:CopG family transcriptional regulator [Gemmatimonadaceae bacterium]
MTDKYAKVTVSIPQADLARADEVASAQDRSRSWIVAEALRQYTAQWQTAQEPTLDPSRSRQLIRDLSLTAEQRIRMADDEAMASARSAGPIEQPRVFAGYDAFAAWRRERRDK